MVNSALFVLGCDGGVLDDRWNGFFVHKRSPADLRGNKFMQEQAGKAM
jgi:hypothetical protein